MLRLDVRLRTMLMAFRRTSRSALYSPSEEWHLGFAEDAPGEDLENVHDEGVEDMTMLGSERVEAVKNDDLRVVVRLLLDEGNVARRSSYQSASS